MKHKNFMVLATLIVCLLCTACHKEPLLQTQSYSAFESDVTKEMIYDFSTEIVHATVMEKTKEYFTNPNGKTDVRNTWVTEYNVKIHQVFKGDIKEESITVRTYNGADLTSEEFDPKAENNFYLSEGQECILSLYSYEDQAGYGTGWNCVPLYGEQSYFLPTEVEGQFINSKGISLDIATLTQEFSE